MKEIRGHAPEEIWQEIQKWVPISCIDLVIEYGNKGLIMVRRKLSPYQGLWAFPGLRILRGETDEEAIKRIAKSELDLEVDPSMAEERGSFNAEFGTRQDISRAFILRVSDEQKIKMNEGHFSEVIIVPPGELPGGPMGEMYKHFLKLYGLRKAGDENTSLNSQ